MVPYDVQLIGGIALHQGKVAEMATGEGKTLVATMPLYLNALAGRGAHLVTVNSYLAQRDSEWMGTSTSTWASPSDCIDLHEPGTPERRAAYRADITYGTNNEFGFDYLRDNMVHALEQRVQRGALLRDHRRGGLDPDRRGAHAAHHLRAGRRREQTDAYRRVQPGWCRDLSRKQTRIVERAGRARREKDRSRRTTTDDAGEKLLAASAARPKNKRLLKLFAGNKPLVQKLVQQVEGD